MALKNILIVDDEPAYSRVLERLLRTAGYHVVTTEQGAEALQLLQDKRFDVAIFDVIMPELGGLDLLKLAREVDPSLPVILMTAMPVMEDSMEATKAGAIRYMLKPLDHAELLSAISAGVRMRKAMARFSGEHSVSDDTAEIRTVPAEPAERDVVNLKLGGLSLAMSKGTADMVWKGLKWAFLAIISALAGFGGYHGTAKVRQIQQQRESRELPAHERRMP